MSNNELELIQSRIYQHDSHTMAVHYESIEQFKRYYDTIEKHARRLKNITKVMHIIKRELEQ